MRTTSELPRILAVSLLWCGVLVIALYTGVAIVVGLFSDSEALGRFRGVIYLSGLLVVPIALALVVAGGGLLMSQRRKRRQ